MPVLNITNIKVLFLVGGLGSNRFLANFIRNRVSKGIVVMQPDAAFVSRKDELTFQTYRNHERCGALPTWTESTHACDAA